MRGFILSIGEELLRGDIVDTNAAYLAQGLSNLGVEVRQICGVGDDLSELVEALRRSREQAQVVVTTGGLGPTEDDLTRQAIAAVLGEDLEVNPVLLEGIEERFRAMGREMPPNNRQQAYLIPSAQPIPNENGTAPGWLVHGPPLIAALPGPPGEMRPMWETSVEPAVAALIPGQVAMISLMTYGLGESTVAERIADIIQRRDVIVATYAKAAGVEVHITARAGDLVEAQHRAEETAREVRGRLGTAVFGEGDQTLSSVVGDLLSRQGLSLATMESATGGMLSDLITDTAGSSGYFLGGIVAYQEEVKARYGVPSGIMRQHGLISAETACAMARAAREQLGSDVGVGISGIAGLEPVEGKAPGTAYVAVDMQGKQVAREVRRPGRRDVAKRFFAQSALDLLRRELTGKDLP